MTKRNIHNTMYHMIIDQLPSSARWITRDTYKDFRRKGFSIRHSILLTDTMTADHINRGLRYGSYKTILK